MRTELLSKDEEMELGYRAKNGDMEARQILIESNMNLVYSITNKFRNYSDYEEIVSEAMYGLCQAVDHFDPDKGRFSTMAYSWINKYPLKYYEKNRNNMNIVSLDNSLDDDNETSLIDVIADDVDFRKDSRIFEINNELKNCLSNIEYNVLKDLKGLENSNPITAIEVAKKHNITPNELASLQRSINKKILNNPLLADLATEC